MAEYIVWVKQADNDCWSRHDASIWEMAKNIRDREGGSAKREAIITKPVLEARSATSAPSAPATPEAGPATSVPLVEPLATTGDTVVSGAAVTAEPQMVAEPKLDSEAKPDREIQTLSQLKGALDQLDPPAVWRVVHWALEYAKHQRNSTKS